MEKFRYVKFEEKSPTMFSPNFGFLSKNDIKKSMYKKMLINIIASPAIMSVILSTRNVSKVLENGILSYLLTTPHRQKSPARGRTKFTA